jgi:hypothetical protein
MSKITKATLKSFIKKNKDNLYINVKSKFDGMTDSCESAHNGFSKAQKDNSFDKNKLGYKGIWLVHGSGNYFREYEDMILKGIEVYNCCGRFIVATEKSL